MEVVFIFVLIALMALALGSGFPVAFALPGSAIIAIAAAALTGYVLEGTTDAYFAVGGPAQWLSAGVTNLRGVYWEVERDTLIAIPLFIFMGIMLQRSKIAEDLLVTMAQLFGPIPGGLGISVVFVGALLAATTGVVAATVTTMGLISLPAMLRAGYDKTLATGVIVASGTLGQIIPPSIVLVVLGDQLGISVGDLFIGALLPGLLMSAVFAIYVLVISALKPELAPELKPELAGSSHPLQLVQSVLPPIALIMAVLGSIFFGIATPTEAGVIGAVGAMVLAGLNGGFSRQQLSNVCESTMRTTAMVMAILMGSTAFSLVFRGVGGDQLISELLLNLPGGRVGFLVFSMLIIFLLGFFIDFFEIAFIAVPLLLPAARQLLGPEALVWFGVMIGANLQTSFLTPPFGFALFYLRGVAPDEVSTGDIYRGALPFVGLQVAVLALIIAVPGLVDWLPRLAGALSPGPMT